MPLTMAECGSLQHIKKICAKEDACRFLNNLGFVPGCPVSVVNMMGGNVIVNVKDSRIALSREMASRIFV